MAYVNAVNHIPEEDVLYSVKSMYMLLTIFQEKMYDFEQNKRNNLIFYGLYQEFKENQETLR